MNHSQVNELRASIGLKPLPARERDTTAKKRQAANRAARAAESQRLKSIRAKGK